MTVDHRETVDLRLAPSALAAWVSALLALRSAPRHAWTAAVVLVTIATFLLLREARRDRGGRPRRIRGSTPSDRAGVGRLGRLLASAGAPTALALLTAAGVLGAAGAHVAARQQGLLPGLAAAQDVGQVLGRVTAEPTRLPASWPGAPPRVRVVLAALRVEGDGRAGPATGSVVVVGPTAWSQVSVGERVRGTGRLVPGSGGRTVALLTATGPPGRVAPPAVWDAVANRARARVVALAQRLPPDARGLLPGVTVGDTREVPDDLRAALRTSGLTHLTAVSGAHFTLVTGLVLALVTGLGLPRAARGSLVVAATGALVVLVHPSASVLRAAAMGLVGVLGLLVGRPSRAPAALALGVVVLLVGDPWLAAEIGFALSVLATAGLVLLAGPIAERWAPRLGRGLATALAVPVAAQVVCAPAILLVTPTVAPLAALANLAVAPVVAPATVLGLAAGLLDSAWPAGAHVLTWVAGAACWWIATVARCVCAVPSAQVAWLGGPLGVLLLALAGVGLVRAVLSGARAGPRPGARSGRPR